MRQPHAKPAVKPAGGLHTKSKLKKLVHHTRTAKQQNQAQAHHKGRCDDRQHGQHVKRLGVAAGGALGHQGHQGTQQGGGGRRHQAQKERIPGHTAGSATAWWHDAAEPEVALTRHPLQNRAHGKHTVFGKKGRTQRFQDRKHNEERQQAAAPHDSGRHKQVAPEIPAPCNAESRQHQQGRQNDKATPAHARLARIQHTPTGRHRLKSPAPCADEKAAHQQSQGRQAATQHQHQALASPRRQQRT